MTTQQLKVVIAAAELQSISAASKLLNISQPNASSSIHLLEEEIGFAIFTRGSSGSCLTAKGAQFLNHARKIISENEAIMNIRNVEETYRLRVGSANYSAAIGPFLELSEAHRGDETTDFRFYNVSVTEGIHDLAKRSLDIVIAPVLKQQIAGVTEECRRNDVHAINIGSVPSVIYVRKGHPAAQDGRCARITQGCDLMKEFPYVAYRNLLEDSSAAGCSDADFIPSSGRILVDTADTRMRVVAATNGFSFGVQSTTAMREQYGLVSFPVKGVNPEVLCLTRPNERERREIAEYLFLLKKELFLTLKG